MEFSGIEKIVEENEGDDGWVTHENDEEENDINQSVAEMTLDSGKLDELRDKGNTEYIEEEEEALDMEDFEESGMLENVDPSVAIITPSTAGECTNNETNEDSVVHTRTYDLHIVYNKYYQTPHLFLIGYDENKKLLSVDEMFEDVSQDNAKKTVTFEQHPHLGPSMLAVHPCRHGDLMKKFIQIVS